MRAQVFEQRSAPKYWVVFAILAVFTGLEVATAYLPALPAGVKIAVLGFLAVVKVALVLLYFMHLRFDSRMYALPFVLGIVLALPLLLIVGLSQKPLPVQPEASGVNATGQVIDVTLVSFQVKLSQDSANAGPVTFHIVNNAADILHEFILIQSDEPASELPTDMMGRVAEDDVTIITAAEDIPPSQSVNLPVTLGAGHYVLICNLPGHYQQGMRVDFTVTGTSSEPASTPESTPQPTSVSGTATAP